MTPPTEAPSPQDLARPYAPRLVATWLADAPRDQHRAVDGTVAFVDISGFTKLSERLARRGKVGAEELTDAIGGCFEQLMGVAYDHGAGLLKFGGDALLLFFGESDHALDAARAAAAMRRTLRQIGPIGGDPALGERGVSLQMSVGVHTGRFDFFLVGESHRELVVTGPAASRVVIMEQTAERGEIVVSDELAATLPEGVLGPAKGPGRLLRREPGGTGAGPLDLGRFQSTGDLTQVLPAGLREHLLSGAVEPEHRGVTVAFVQFRGTDALITEDGADAAVAEIDRLVRDTQRAAERHGIAFLGSDVDLDGGKLILAGGAPVTTGSDERQMLLALREVVGVDDRRLRVRAGVNCGHVFAGEIGPSYRRTYTVMGDAVNLAARVMGQARPGTVLMTDAVGERSTLRFETTALEPFAVKGKSALVHAAEVGAPLGVVADGRPSARARFVGRETERALLDAALDRAVLGRGGVVEVSGEPGVGKTRLVDDAVSDRINVRRVDGVGLAYEQLSPYFGVRRLLREVIGMPVDLPDAEAGAHLLRFLAEDIPALLSWSPLLAVAFDADVETTAEVERLDAGFRKPRLEAAVGDLLDAVLTEPTVLVVDDAHWLDEASADLIRSLIPRLGDRPWLLCTLRRPGRAGLDLGTLSTAELLRLPPLDDGSMTALLESLTEEEPLTPHQSAALVSRSGGNPLFLAELLAARSATGDLDSLPDSLEAVVMARIDQLPSADRSLVRRLSVLGTEFEHSLAAAVVADLPASDDPTWGRLSDFITVEGPRLKFVHTLVRDGAYESTPFRLRRLLHAHVGEALESTADDLEEAAGLLSLHYWHARRFADSLAWARRAAAQAQEVYAAVEAADFYQRAIEAATKLPEAVPDLAALHESHGDVRQRIGEFSRAAQSYRLARIGYRTEPTDHARLLLKQAVVRQRMGRFGQSRRWLARARQAVDGIDNPAAASIRAQIDVTFASIAKDEGRMQLVVKWSTRALEAAEAAGDRESMARAYSLLDATFGLLGRWEEAAYSDHALALYTELDDLWGQGVVLNNLGTRAYWQGRWDDAVELYQRGERAWEQIGDSVNAAISAINVGEIRSDQGRLEEAETLMRRAMRVWAAAGDAGNVAYARSHLGRLLARAGRHEEAQSLLEQAQAEFHSAGADGELRETEARIAECLVLRGEADLALALVDTPDHASAPQQDAVLSRIAGWAHLIRGSTALARQAFDQSLAAAGARRMPFDAALAQRGLAAVARAVGEDPTAMVAAADAALADLGVVSVAEPVLPDVAAD